MATRDAANSMDKKKKPLSIGNKSGSIRCSIGEILKPHCSQTKQNTTITSDTHQSQSRATCPICLDIIVDPSPEHDGENSICCDGFCQEWLHRHCAALSVVAFKAINKDQESPFFCPHCKLANQSKEIMELKSNVLKLSQTTDDLSQTLRSSSKNQVTLGSGQCRLSAVDGYRSGSSPTPSNEGATPRRVCVGKEPSKQFDSQSRKPDDNRQLNVVVYGIPECTKGQPRKQRWVSDLRIVTDLFHKSSASVPKSAIRDIVDALVNSQILAPILVQS